MFPTFIRTCDPLWVMYSNRGMLLRAEAYSGHLVKMDPVAVVRLRQMVCGDWDRLSNGGVFLSDESEDFVAEERPKSS